MLVLRSIVVGAALCLLVGCGAVDDGEDGFDGEMNEAAPQQEVQARGVVKGGGNNPHGAAQSTPLLPDEGCYQCPPAVVEEHESIVRMPVR